MKIAGVILAGGKATRMGGANKALLQLGNKPLVTHVADRLTPQISVLGVNANRDVGSFLLPIVSDNIGGNLGPLVGILGAMMFAEQNGCTHALTVSVDTPFIPIDLAAKLSEKSNNQIAIANSNGRIHGTCGLWPVQNAAGLRAFILSGKSLKLMDYLNQIGFVEVAFEGTDPDPFFNINTPGDLAAAARWL
jgi:molybdenum cofactor guanylyltransferase